MTRLAAVWSELFGVFVDDGVFAGAIVGWLAACWLGLPHLAGHPLWPAIILPAGLILILTIGAIRKARGTRASSPPG